jgi:hypothetical protein
MQLAPGGGLPAKLWHPELRADRSGGAGGKLAMPGDGRPALSSSVDPDLVPRTLPQSPAAVPVEVAQQKSPLDQRAGARVAGILL